MSSTSNTIFQSSNLSSTFSFALAATGVFKPIVLACLGTFLKETKVRFKTSPPVLGMYMDTPTPSKDPSLEPDPFLPIFLISTLGVLAGAVVITRPKTKAKRKSIRKRSSRNDDDNPDDNPSPGVLWKRVRPARRLVRIPPPADEPPRVPPPDDGPPFIPLTFDDEEPPRPPRRHWFWYILLAILLAITGFIVDSRFGFVSHLAISIMASPFFKRPAEILLAGNPFSSRISHRQHIVSAIVARLPFVIATFLGISELVSFIKSALQVNQQEPTADHVSFDIFQDTLDTFIIEEAETSDVFEDALEDFADAIVPSQPTLNPNALPFIPGIFVHGHLASHAIEPKRKRRKRVRPKKRTYPKEEAFMEWLQS